MILHTPNIWKGRAAYIEAHSPASGKLKTGTPPLVIVSGSIRVEDISTSTDHVGTTIIVNYNAQYTGDFDPIYISGNASSLGFPWYGDYYAGATGLVYCSKTDCKYVGGLGDDNLPGVFRYTATFSPITPERLDLSPLDRPAVVQGGGIELTEVRRQDTQGLAIVNAVGDYYENLPEFYIPGSEFQVSWNVADNPLSLATEYSFTTNSGGIWGQDTGAGVVGKIALEETFETYQGTLIQFWRLTVPFKFRNDGLTWKFMPFNYGYRYKNSSGNTVNYIDPATGVFGPVFLNADGTLLNGNGSAIGTAPNVYPSGGYETLVAVDFSSIGVPINPFA